jgi:hypothetical protein
MTRNKKPAADVCGDSVLLALKLGKVSIGLMTATKDQLPK